MSASHLNELIVRRYSRREVLKIGSGAATLGFLSPLAGCLSSPPLIAPVSFASLPVSRQDGIVVARGYTATPFYSWGDPVSEGPAWNPDASQGATEQALQAGDNHDGMHFFPLPKGSNSSTHGLLAINHEYVNPPLHPNGPSASPRPLSEIRKEQAAHGVSVIEVRRNASGQWFVVRPSSFARRITANTPMRIAGPATGHPKMQTVSDPAGTTVLGTLNNCAHGFTPWGTYLTCEENWDDYFINSNAEDRAARREHARYGVSATSEYAWSDQDARFNATPDATGAPSQVHEPNRFGWVVEIDPYDPQSQPVKRTAMGRLVREGATLSLGADGRMAFYMGDDARGEYFYKFVPEARFSAANPNASRNALDSGTLYVAVLNEDGSGRWVPLKHGDAGLGVAEGFADQADVLINARSAADAVAATPMDRPEWFAVNPGNRDVYLTLTNNSNRGAENEEVVNAANPRTRNLHGHILKLVEANADPAATEFRWEIFLLAGNPAASDENLRGNIKGDAFGSPDGLWFDHFGQLWIETDYDDANANNAAFGNCQLLAANPQTREVRRFLVGPNGCEVTGCVSTPDGTTLFINIQHPTGSFPAGDGRTRPRSSTVAITKDSGGVIGT